MKALHAPELRALLAVAAKYSWRDELMYRLMFNHAMRVTELVGGWLKQADGSKVWWDGLHAHHILPTGHIVVPRLKGSLPVDHPVLNDEREALLKLCALVPEGRLFPITRMTAWRHIKKYGIEAGIEKTRVFNHVLKHTCGRLGYKGGMTPQEQQKYMGHVNVNNTMVYSQATVEEAAKAFAAAVGA